jgi:hypothetical protein
LPASAPSAPKIPRKFFTDEQAEIIRANWNIKSRKEIAEMIGIQ